MTEKFDAAYEKYMLVFTVPGDNAHALHRDAVIFAETIRLIAQYDEQHPPETQFLDEVTTYYTKKV